MDYHSPTGTPTLITDHIKIRIGNGSLTTRDKGTSRDSGSSWYTLCGAPIYEMPGVSQRKIRHIANIGCVIQIGSEFYGLTTFLDGRRTYDVPKDMGKDDQWLFSSDVGPQGEREYSMANELTDFTYVDYPDLPGFREPDWGLVRLDQAEQVLPNAMHHGDEYHVGHLRGAAEELPQDAVNVHILTSPRKAIDGVLTRTTIPLRNAVGNYWRIRYKDSLERFTEGNAGSLVVDELTRDIYGLMIGDLVFPLAAVLKQIQAVLPETTVSLPNQLQQATDLVMRRVERGDWAEAKMDLIYLTQYIHFDAKPVERHRNGHREKEAVETVNRELREALARMQEGIDAKDREMSDFQRRLKDTPSSLYIPSQERINELLGVGDTRTGWPRLSLWLPWLPWLGSAKKE